jgi:hypothetical protein
MADGVIDVFKQKGFTGIELKKDLQGRDRMIRVEKLIS